MYGPNKRELYEVMDKKNTHFCLCTCGYGVSDGLKPTSRQTEAHRGGVKGTAAHQDPRQIRAEMSVTSGFQATAQVTNC